MQLGIVCSSQRPPVSSYTRTRMISTSSAESCPLRGVDRFFRIGDRLNAMFGIHPVNEEEHVLQC